MSDYPYIYAWGNNTIRAERKGKRCRVVWTGRKNTVAVEFEDGFQMTTSYRALRKANR